MKYDFSGYVTKNNIRCKDGRTILKDAFAHQDGQIVPLVWQHMHSSNENVLGHCLLENRDDGVYGYASLNGTDNGVRAKEQVAHGDLNAFSIWADELDENRGFVAHGDIKEVSLCLGGANMGAIIDNVVIAHSDGSQNVVDGEAVMKFFEPISLDPGDTDDPKPDDVIAHAATGGSSSGSKSIQDVINTMNEEQQDVLYGLIGEALESKANMQHSSIEGGDKMRVNVFDKTGTKPSNIITTADGIVGAVITHSQFETIAKEAKECGSWKKAYLAHAQEYGIGNIEYLFPEARSVTNPPTWVKRDTEWVAGVLNGVKKVPFSKIKSMSADITADEARARGYIKGHMKKEEFFSLAKRETGPITVYKKQKLDRDDIIDATELDVVNWLWGEMRLMLNEELARAILIGDGREVDDEDKIKSTGPNCIRAVWTDDEFYTTHIDITETDVEAELDAIIVAMQDYKGTGTPTMYVPKKTIVRWKLIKDKNGRRIYNTTQEIADLLGVRSIVEVEVMNGATRDADEGGKKELKALIVNLNDYYLGTNAGGQIAKFDDFDIDFNQYKYLLETRLTGTLVNPKTALAIEAPVV